MKNDVEWKMVKLGDVCTMPTKTISSNTFETRFYVGTENMLQNCSGVIDNEISISTVRVREYKNDDILMSNIRPYLKKIWFSDKDAGCSTDVNIFRATDKCFPKYLFHVLCQDDFFNYVNDNAIGTKMPRGDKRIIPSFLIPIPYKNGAPDLETQKQIAQKLGDMDSLIAAKEMLLAKKRNLKVAAMQKLIKDEEGENWKKVKLGDVAEFLPTNTLSRDELNYSEGEYLNIHYGDVLIKFESVTDVLNSEIPYVSLNKKFSDKSLLKNGDIVMTDTAEDESVGKVTEIQNIGNCKVVSGLHTLCIRFQENLFAPKFAGYYLNSPAFHNLLLPYMHGTKVTSISKGDVKKINFPIPYKNSAPDLTEQRRIASILSDVDSEITAIEKEITKLQKLKTAMMQKMFCFEDSDSSSE